MNRTSIADSSAPKGTMRALALGLLAAAAALPAGAGALEKLAVLAVDAPPGPSPELAALAGRVREVAAARDPQGVLSAPELRDRMGPKAAADLASLDESFDAARAAALRHDFEGSLETLKALTEALERLPDGEEVFSRWTKTLLRIAKIESDLGHPEVARRALDRLVRAAPDLSVDPELYPPKFVGILEEARAALRALPHGRLTVSSAERDARVFVGGRDVGTAPLTLSLSQGRYRISGVAAGLRAEPDAVDLGPQDLAVSLDFEPARALRPDAGPGLALPRANRDRALLAACASLQLEQVLAVRFDEDGGRAFAVGSLWDVRRGALLRERRVPLGPDRGIDDASAAELSQTLLSDAAKSLADASRARADAPAPSADASASAVAGIFAAPATPEASAPRVSPSAGWISTGAGAASLGLGGVALWQGLSARSSYASARGMLSSDGYLQPGGDLTRYQALLGKGDAAARRATVTGIGAAACALASAALGYLSYRQAGQVGPLRF